MRDPYTIVKSRYGSEKALMLERLKTAESNPSLKACKSPKYVFIVDRKATKHAIKAAIEELYADKQITVTAVNTLLQKPKLYAARGKRRPGRTNTLKKAIVTLAEGDTIDEG